VLTSIYGIIANTMSTAWQFEDYLGWNEQGDGKLFYGVYVQVWMCCCFSVLLVALVAWRQLTALPSGFGSVQSAVVGRNRWLKHVG
jgi:hypothetical protein